MKQPATLSIHELKATLIGQNTNFIQVKEVLVLYKKILNMQWIGFRLYL